MSSHPHPSRRQRSARLLIAWAIASVGLFIGAQASTATAAENKLPPSTLEGWRENGNQLGDVNIPDCNSRNLDGGLSGFARWTVTSSLGDGSTVFPGEEWTVKLEMESFDLPSWGNDGPSPLTIDMWPLGSPSPGAPPVPVAYDQYHTGDGYTGLLGDGIWGDWGGRFDMNSSPGLLESGDGVRLDLTVTYRAEEPGVVGLGSVRVSGYDPTPIAGSISCFMQVGWIWNVVAPDEPLVQPETAATDATYVDVDPQDANSGPHGVMIDVLSNDDDPNVAGGPGDLDQVRLASWDTVSAHGGVVSCGAPGDNGLPAGTPLSDLSAGPCRYDPPVGFDGIDTFTYVVRSATAHLERSGSVAITVRPNRRPSANPAAFGTTVNTDDSFSLAGSVGDLDNDPLACSGAGPVSPAAGIATVGADCVLIWDNTSPGFTGNVTVPYRVCDTHPTLAGVELGDATRATGYSDGDVSASNARRCATAEVTIAILAGLVLPPIGVTDFDLVDAGYGAEGIGVYSVRLPVLNNDTDGNGPDPQVPGSTMELLTSPDPSVGTATADGGDILFSPTDGYSGEAVFTYRVCEDPLAQNPPYVDDPNTPLVNEGLPYCGVGTVAINVLGNAAPVAQPDAGAMSSITPLAIFDVGLNDVDPEGEGLTCTTDQLVVSDPALVEVATIDAGCIVSVNPVDDASGSLVLTYEVCDQHTLATPLYSVAPYGTDGRSPGDLAPRCSTAELTIQISAPGDDDEGDQLLGDPPPVCADDQATTTEDESVSVEVLANDTDLDADDQSAEVVLTGPPADEPAAGSEGGAAAMNEQGDAVVYAPPAGFTGTDQVVYTARDSVGQGCQAFITITVIAATEPAGPTTTAPNPLLPETGGDATGALMLIAACTIGAGLLLRRVSRQLGHSGV